MLSYVFTIKLYIGLKHVTHFNAKQRRDDDNVIFRLSLTSAKNKSLNFNLDKNLSCDCHTNESRSYQVARCWFFDPKQFVTWNQNNWPRSKYFTIAIGQNYFCFPHVLAQLSIILACSHLGCSDAPWMLIWRLDAGRPRPTPPIFLVEKRTDQSLVEFKRE